jgi:hypothetical protein
VERPIRFGKHGKAKVAFLVVLMTIVTYVGYNTYERSGLGFRLVNAVNSTMSSGGDGGDGGNMINDCGIEDESIRKLFAICAMDKRGSVRFALMGDSKAAALYTGLVRTSTENGRWLVIGGQGPNGAPAPLLPADSDSSRPLTNYAIEAISNNDDIDTVVLVTAIRAIFALNDGVINGNLATYDYGYLKTLPSSKRFDDAFSELNKVVSKFTDKGKKVIIVVDNPALPNPQDCIGRSTPSETINQFLTHFNRNCTVQTVAFNAQIELYRALLNKVKLAHSDSVRIFDPTYIYCNLNIGNCMAIKNGRLMYSYTDHISDYASGLVGHELNDFLKIK